MNLSSCSIRLRRSSSRPANAVLERLGDVLDLADPTAVEQQRDRGQRLLGASGRCSPTTAGSASLRAACPPVATSVGGASSMCSEPSRLVWPTLGRRVGGQLDVAVELHRHQRVPALALDLGDVADGDVADPDARVRLDVVHVGHLRLDRERARARCPGCPAAEASSGPASSQHAGQCRDGQREQDARGGAPPACPHHGPPPGGTIMPGSPSAGLVASAAASARPAADLAGAARVALTGGRAVRPAGRLRRNVVRPHPILAVGDLVRPRRGTDEQVLRRAAGSCTGGS